MKRTIVILMLAALPACGGGGNNGDVDAQGPIDGSDIDSSLYDAGPDASCVENPQTSAQLMNACTDAEKIDKVPQIPTSATSGCWFDGIDLPDLP